MKKFLVVFFAIMLNLCGYGQAKYYKPFYNNPSWTIVYTNFGISNYLHYKYQKDSVIGANTYKKIQEFSNQNTNSSGYYLFREDIANKKIYQRNTSTSQDYLYIDFTLTVGAQFQLTILGSTFNSTVTAKDSALVSGNYHTSIILTDAFNTSYRFTEGVISLKDPVNPKISGLDPQYYLVCMCKAGYSYYSLSPTSFTCGLICSPPPLTSILENSGSEIDINVWPNPHSDLLKIKVNSSGTAILVIYNAVGQEVEQQMFEPGKSEVQLNTSNWPSGVYLLSLKQANGNCVNKRIIIDR